MNNDRVQKLRRWVLVLTIVVVAGAVSAPIVANYLIDKSENETQLTIICVSAEANIEQLRAIRRNGIVIDDIARSLGLPILFRPPVKIPELPEECE